jgi:excinuclease ABC subunit A
VFDDSIKAEDNQGREQTFAEADVEDLMNPPAPPATARA